MANKRKYPFHVMEVTDSFLMRIQAAYERKRLDQAACRYGKRNGKMFNIRKVSEGVRVWRTK